MLLWGGLPWACRKRVNEASSPVPMCMCRGIPGVLTPNHPLPPQVVYYTEMHKIFGDLTEQIAEPGLTDEQREKENEAKLSELRALSIVADD